MSERQRSKPERLALHARIVELHRGDSTLKRAEIAARLGCGVATVLLALRRAGVVAAVIFGPPR